MFNCAIHVLTDFIIVNKPRHSRLSIAHPCSALFVGKCAKLSSAGIFYLCLLAGLDRFTHRQPAKYKTDHAQALNRLQWLSISLNEHDFYQQAVYSRVAMDHLASSHPLWKGLTEQLDSQLLNIWFQMFCLTAMHRARFIKLFKFANSYYLFENSLSSFLHNSSVQQK